MNRFSIILFFLSIMLRSPVANAKTLSAVCQEPSGYGIYYKNGSSEFHEDKIIGATNTYSWDMAKPKATIVMQDTKSAGGKPTSYEAVVIPVTKNQLAFLMQYEGGVELHSLYFDIGEVVMSPHKDLSSFFPNGASGKILRAKCQISFQ